MEIHEAIWTHFCSISILEIRRSIWIAPRVYTCVLEIVRSIIEGHLSRCFPRGHTKRMPAWKLIRSISMGNPHDRTRDMRREIENRAMQILSRARTASNAWREHRPSSDNTMARNAHEWFHFSLIAVEYMATGTTMARPGGGTRRFRETGGRSLWLAAF